MPSGLPAVRASPTPVRSRGRARAGSGTSRRSQSAHVDYEILPAYSSTPRPSKPKRRTKTVEAGLVASSRPKNQPRDKVLESNTLPRRKHVPVGGSGTRNHGDKNQSGNKNLHDNQKDRKPNLENYQPGLRASSLPPEKRGTPVPNRGSAFQYPTANPYSTLPRNKGQGQNNTGYPKTPDYKAVYPDPVSELLKAMHPPDLIYPDKGSVYFQNVKSPRQGTQAQQYPRVEDNKYTDGNDNIVWSYPGSNGSYLTPESLSTRSGPSPIEGIYQYPNLQVNTGTYSDMYTPKDTHSEGSLPSPKESPSYRGHSRQGSQPILSEMFDYPSAVYAQVSPKTRHPGVSPARPQHLDTYPSTEPIYTQPLRRRKTTSPTRYGQAQSPYGYGQQFSPYGSEPTYAEPSGGSSTYSSPTYGGPQDYGSSAYGSPDDYGYSTLPNSSVGTYRSPQAQYVHQGNLVDESHLEQTHNHWTPDGTLHRTHCNTFHWRIFPHYTDLVMIPFKGKDRSIVRIERLTQGNVNYKAAHYVAEGPFKGIVINKAASDLKSVGRADLTLSFDVSMTDKKHKVNPEYKERRKVHFWFKPDADNTDLGREYMRQLLKPEGFPRDYTSFIKKALVLTQRFPLIQRIDIVLIPQYFDERDSGYANGDVRSPTHEDWLKTTPEERAARMRAQGLGAAPPSASLDPGQERKNRLAEEERKRKEEQERKQREEDERKRREEEERKRREEEQKRRDEERKRREEAERKRREEEERKRREAEQRERKRREDEELRRRAEEEREWREQQEKAKREAERLKKEQEEHKWKRRQEEERLRREKEEEERLRKEREEEEQRKLHVEKLSNVNLTSQPSVEEDEVIQNFITVMTPAVYDYQYLPEVSVSDKTNVAFRLKAKSDAHVALSSVYGDTERKTYEIVLGAHDNTKSMIRHGGEGPVMVEKMTRNVLDGDEFRSFWISWAKGQIIVGEGMEPGEDAFLVWNVPENKIHSVNCMAVSTAPGSEGQWEFIEYIYPRKPEEETREAKRARFRTSLMWLAKKQKMLQVLEDAYPNSVNTPDLLRICNIGLSDMMTAVVMLKEFDRRGLITEVVKGVWIRSPSGAPGDQHIIKVVDHLPVLKGRDIPTIAIVTSLYCEKLAVDAMMEHKVSYVKYKTEEDGSGNRGESHVYTVGRIGNHMCVSTKLSRVGGSRGATIAAGNSVTRLLGIFDKVDHVIFVGSGGAVPDYHDYTRHVRLADIVVSCPNAKQKQQQPSAGGPIYMHCEKFRQIEGGKYDFETKPFEVRDEAMQTCVTQMKQMSEKGAYTRGAPWEKFIEQGLAALNAEESNFSKPSLKKDKLFAWVDEQRVQVEHPKPPKGQEYLYREGQTHVRYGPIACGKYLAPNEKLRYDFARKHGVMAYDIELDACLEAVIGSRKESFIVIRGIADYQDGSKSKEWQPYASLVAAAYMKALVSAMPTSYGRSGYYR